MHWVDTIYFPELANRLADLDRRLQALGEECDRSPDSDTPGILDDVENVIGEEFSCCQHDPPQSDGAKRVLLRNAFPPPHVHQGD